MMIVSKAIGLPVVHLYNRTFSVIRSIVLLSPTASISPPQPTCTYIPLVIIYLRQ